MLRAVAAGMVVVHHSIDILSNTFPGVHSVVVGAAGVDIFFVLSGVVIALSEHGRPPAPGGFLLRRIIRVWPMYWLALWLIGLGVIAGASPVGVQPVDGTIGNMLKSMFFIPFERAHGAIMPLLGVGWTLNYEMFFYLVFALLIFLPDRVRALALMGTMVVLALLGLALSPENVVLSFFSNPILLEFAAGVGLAQLWIANWGAGRHDRVAGAALLALGVAGFVLMNSPEGFSQLMLSRVLVFGIPAVLCVAGAMLIERSGLSIKSRFWMELGAASYVLYLFHSFVLQIVFKGGNAAGLQSLGPVAQVAAAIFAFVLAHLVAVFLHRRVEKPVTAMLNRIVGRQSDRLASSPVS
ncbi:acyltransferase family protein [Pseudooceanicola sp. C21-150M6]|uniref:acyltransferase family protein n=1 Tax=Pseudooceanicola sp. C21-150M6 TaxID=3434355 RepID=UPI003D7FC2A2